MPACNKCGHCVSDDAKFCPECGQKQGKTCAQCGVPLPPESKFCSECGNDVASAAIGGDGKTISLEDGNKPNTSLDEALEAINNEDYSTALRLLHPLAKQGDSDAQFLIGLSYSGGLGVEKDLHEAFTWFLKAAEQENAEAQFAVAGCYIRGVGVKEDGDKSFTWALRAAEQGHADAQAIVGFCYNNGRGGVEADEVKAFTWYLKAAKQGHADAQYNLGLFYINGTGGVEEDQVEGLTWLRKADEQGNTDAHNMLVLRSALDSVLDNQKNSLSPDVGGAIENDSSESIDLDEIVRGFASDPDKKFYVAPELPIKKIRNFTAKYSYEIDENSIIAYFDETLFGSGDNGVLIDSVSVNINVTQCKDRCVMIHRINTVEISGLLNKTITLKLSDGENVSFTLTQSNNGALLLCELIQKIIDFVA